MKMITTNYLLEENNEAPENATVKECVICGRKFAVPNSEIGNETEICCSDCESEYNKKLSVDNINSMKSETNDTISTALGQ